MPAFDLASSDAWLWLGGSLLLAALWTNLTWLFAPWIQSGRAPQDSESLAERTIIRLANWRFAPTVFGLLRLLYYVGLPLAALLWGYDAIIARFLGLQPLVVPAPGAMGESARVNENWSNWGHDIGWATALFVGTCGVLLVAGCARRRALGTGSRSERQGAVWGSLQEAVYHEVHWAFYRSVPIAVFGLYWGTWTGLLLVALEALANPVWRKGLLSPERSAALLLRGALAVVSSLLFLRTQNLWLAIPLHWAVEYSLGSLYLGQSVSPPKDARAAV